MVESLRGIFGETNQSELAAFISYASAFPNNFLALVDTYDVSQLKHYLFCIFLFSILFNVFISLFVTTETLVYDAASYLNLNRIM